MSGKRAAATLGIALGLCVLASAQVAAHALIVSSQPAPGTSVDVAPSTVTVTFSKSPDPKLSSLKVLDTTGTSVTSGPTAAVPGDAQSLQVPLADVPDGVYTVAWRTVSADDGHAASGSFAFGVGVAAPAPSNGASDPASAAGQAGTSPGGVVGRWLLYLGLVGLVGAAFVGLVIRDPVPRSTVPLGAVAWALGAAGTALVILTQIWDAGIDASQLTGTSLGMTAALRTVTIAAAGLCLLAASSQRPPGRRWLLGCWVAAAAAMAVDAAASHAAAGGQGPLAVAVQWAHILAVGTWIGGLVALLVSLPRSPDERTAAAVRRFPRWAFAGLVAVSVTGVLRAAAELSLIDQLVTTDFGRLLVVKTAVLLILAGLGAINHFRNVPAVGRSLRGLRRVGSTEAVVGAFALLLAASLVNLAPPISVAVAAAATAVPGPISADGSDFGTTVRVRLAADPGSAGFNEFRASITDYDTGEPLSADAVSLRFAIPARPDVGGSRLDLTAAGTGEFTGTGGNLSLDGAWDVTALVVRGTSPVEVPLELTTRTPETPVDVNVVAGLPTIYTLHLVDGSTLQVYLDPGTSGPNELHATFFDAAGVELPVTDASIAIGPVSGAAIALVPRMLEPGHFVADVTLEPSIYRVVVRRGAINGSTLAARLDVPVTGP